MSLFLKTDKADRRRFLRFCNFVQGLVPDQDFELWRRWAKAELSSSKRLSSSHEKLLWSPWMSTGKDNTGSCQSYWSSPVCCGGVREEIALEATWGQRSAARYLLFWMMRNRFFFASWMCDDVISCTSQTFFLLHSSSLHPVLWGNDSAPGIGWQKDIFQMTQFARALKWMTCFISNDRLAAFTAHLLLAVPPLLCCVAAELRSLREVVTVSPGLWEAGRKCFWQIEAIAAVSTQFQCFWFSPNHAIFGEALVLVDWFPHQYTTTTAAQID